MDLEQAQNKAYLNWLADRGLTYRPAPALTVAEEAATEKSQHQLPKIVFIGDVKDPSLPKDMPFPPDEADLLLKICSAMKLPRERFLFTNLSPTLWQEIGAQPVSALICLGEKAANAVAQTLDVSRPEFWGVLKTISRDKPSIIATFHPRELLVNATLKRHAWDSMQAVMAASN
jgi:uracil-DNA glycosylase